MGTVYGQGKSAAYSGMGVQGNALDGLERAWFADIMADMGMGSRFVR